jgi:galactosamine-6-phosphate isomerase
MKIDDTSATIDGASATPSSLRIIVAEDYEAGSRTAGMYLAEKLEAKPDLLLCAATGNSPTGAYEVFVGEMLVKSSFGGKMRLLKLDEWGGLDMSDPATCEDYLQQKLIRPLRISKTRYVAFQSDANAPVVECQRIQNWIETHGPIDICVLGLGLNGHLGFNEPADALIAVPHVAELTDQSLGHPMLSVTGNRPTHGLTLGMRDILASQSILLLVFGASKAKQLKRLITDGISSQFPASFLSLHEDVMCICDEAAAALLPQDVFQKDEG